LQFEEKDGTSEQKKRRNNPEHPSNIHLKVSRSNCCCDALEPCPVWGEISRLPWEMEHGTAYPRRLDGRPPGDSSPCTELWAGPARRSPPSPSSPRFPMGLDLWRFLVSSCLLLLAVF